MRHLWLIFGWSYMRRLWLIFGWSALLIILLIPMSDSPRFVALVSLFVAISFIDFLRLPPIVGALERSRYDDRRGSLYYPANLGDG